MWRAKRRLQNGQNEWPCPRLSHPDTPTHKDTRTRGRADARTPGHILCPLFGANNRRFIAPRRILWHCECANSRWNIFPAESCVGSRYKCAILLPQIIIESLTSRRSIFPILAPFASVFLKRFNVGLSENIFLTNTNCTSV